MENTKIKKMDDEIVLITIDNGLDLEVTVCNFGASLYSIKYKGKEMLLTPKDFNDFKYATSYFGKTCGRFAGRVKNGKVTINNKEYNVPLNEPTNALHGGKNGYSFKTFKWKIDEDEQYYYVVFKLVDDYSGELPGNVDCNIFYRIDKYNNAVAINYLATTSEDTILNLTCHPYFNLSGDLKTDVLNHTFKLNCNKNAVLDENLIFTDVEDCNPILDFTKGKLIGKDIKDPSIYKKPTGGYDHLFIKADKSKDEVCTLTDNASGTTLSIYSNYPAVVCYTYNWPLDMEFNPGFKATAHYGIAIEPQLEPMSVNKENFEKGILKKFDEYNYSILYCFEN